MVATLKKAADSSLHQQLFLYDLLIKDSQKTPDIQFHQYIVAYKRLKFVSIMTDILHEWMQD